MRDEVKRYYGVLANGVRPERKMDRWSCRTCGHENTNQCVIPNDTRVEFSCVKCRIRCIHMGYTSVGKELEMRYENTQRILRAIARDDEPSDPVGD